MAKKQFIRHLEYYGFPDQNTYTSEINGIDLSDIREKNKEQDKEIQELEGEKAEKKDLLELSGTVENFIDKQDEINHIFYDAISGMSDDIEELKRIDDDFAEQLSAMTDSIDDILETIDEFSADTQFKFAEANERLNAYSRYAANEFAHRSDVYTKNEVYNKDEVDELIGGVSGYATVEWVEEQGFLTEASGDTLYVIKNDFNIYSADVETRIEELSADTYTKAETDELLDKKTDKLIEAVQGKALIFNEADGGGAKFEHQDGTWSFAGVNDGGANGIAGQIYAINKDTREGARIDVSTSGMYYTVGNNSAADRMVAENEIATKGSIEDITTPISEKLDIVSGKVDSNTSDIAWCAREIAKRAYTSALTETRLELLGKIQEVDDKKADKTDLQVVSAAVDSNRAAIEAEKTARREADNILSERITDLGDRVASAESEVRSYDARITNVESGLTKEIAERKQADLDLIGTESDDVNLDTIWAAKNLAAEAIDISITSAKTYTDDRFRLLEGEFIQLSAATDSALTKFATTGYVEQRLQEVLSGDSILDDLQREITERINGDKALEAQILDLADSYSAVSTDVSHLINKVGAITEWDGENPEEYEPWAEQHPGANGILDILHREVHELKPETIEELSGKVNTEIAERQAADTTLHGEIVDEGRARQDADTALENQIKTTIADVTFVGGILTFTKKDGSTIVIDLNSSGSGW